MHDGFSTMKRRVLLLDGEGDDALFPGSTNSAVESKRHNADTSRPVSQAPKINQTKLLSLLDTLRRETAEEEFRSLEDWNNPSISSTVPKSSECIKNWKQHKREMDSGASGSIYTACPADGPLGKNCPFVMKIEDNCTYEQFTEGVRMQNYAAKLGISIPVLCSYHNNRKGVMVMAKLHQTLRDFVENTRDPAVRMAGLQSVIRLVERMHDAGIMHGDIHSSNVMMSEEGRWYMIDFDPRLGTILSPTASRTKEGYQRMTIDWDDVANLMETSETLYELASDRAMEYNDLARNAGSNKVEDR